MFCVKESRKWCRAAESRSRRWAKRMAGRLAVKLGDPLGAYG